MIDLATIPAERLALLRTATLYHGSHNGGGGSECKHCARELAYEIATGEHRDANPPGATAMFSLLPKANDGPWSSDERRTEILKPYIEKMFALDPANDERRIYAIINHVYRSIIPDICDALKLDKHGSALRDLAPITDRKSALNALALNALALNALALNALALALALDARGALALAVALNALALALALDALALDARGAVALNALALALDARGARQQSWERGWVRILDIVCAIP